MLYEVKLSPAERGVLAGLIGQRLDVLAGNGWSAEIHTSTEIVSIEPEEVATPDEGHPHGDVERPRVEVLRQSNLGEHLALLEGPFGVIRAVRVLSTLLSFSPAVAGPPEEILPGVVLPASTGYGWVYYTPTEREVAVRTVAPKQALVDLDIALELVTEKNPGVVLYTRGFFIQVSLEGLPEEEWVEFGAFSRWQLQSLPRNCPFGGLI